MYLEKVFRRVVASATPWTQDVLPANAAGGAVPPYAPGSSVPAGYVGAVDNILSVNRRDDSGFPPLRIVVAYQGPVGAPTVAMNMYAYDRNTGLYYLSPDSPVTLTSGKLAYFGALTLAAPAPTQNAQGGLTPPGATDFVFIATAGATVNGSYSFAMAPAYGRSAP